MAYRTIDNGDRGGYGEAIDKALERSKEFNTQADTLFKKYGGSDGMMDRSEIQRMIKETKGTALAETARALQNGANTEGNRDGRLDKKELATVKEKEKQELIDYETRGG